jgi:hypothetical protein
MKQLLKYLYDYAKSKKGLKDLWDLNHL